MVPFCEAKQKKRMIMLSRRAETDGLRMRERYIWYRVMQIIDNNDLTTVLHGAAQLEEEDMRMEIAKFLNLAVTRLESAKHLENR